MGKKVVERAELAEQQLEELREIMMQLRRQKSVLERFKIDGSALGKQVKEAEQSWV